MPSKAPFAEGFRHECVFTQFLNAHLQPANGNFAFVHLNYDPIKPVFFCHDQPYNCALKVVSENVSIGLINVHKTFFG